MLEVLIAAPGTILSRDIPAPTPPLPGEVLVEIDRVSLCGSDLGIFTGGYGGPNVYPMRFGHEWSGRIVEAETLPSGTPVTGDCSLWCGVCDRCATDRNLCRHIEKAGITAPGFSVSARAIQERYLYADPFDLGPDLLALAEITAVALRGLDKAKLGGPALVMGAGALGQLLTLALIEVGVETYVVEPSRPRAELLAKTAPAARLLAPQDLGATDSYRGLDEDAAFAAAFECSGRAAGLNLAVRLVKPGGTIVCMGLGSPEAVDMALAVVKGLTLVGSIGGTGAFPHAIAFLARHRAAVGRMITHQYPAGEAGAAFARSVADPARLKVQLVFAGGYQ